MAESKSLERWTVALFTSATVAAIAAPVAARAHVALGVAVVLASFIAAPWIARALPIALDGAFARRRLTSVLWMLLATVSVLQVGRMSAFMADASREWGATVPDPAATHHQCLSAYVYAADLDRQRVRNLYDARWYPVFDAPRPTCRVIATPVKGLSPWISDAYEYPPPFLMLPRAALALTASFDTIRAWWFVIQALTLLAAGVLLARWIGGREGLVLGLMLPAVLASLETLFTFQFGQFHAMAMMLGLGAMVAFHERRAALGGGLLAAAILSKLSPAVLLVVLALRREWRALAWTAAFGIAFALLGVAVLGVDPYVAFFTYQLPRLATGAAFAFTNEGAHAVFLLSRNASIAAIAPKLRWLGAPEAAVAIAHAATWAYTLTVLVLAVLVARGERSRAGHALVWLALLDLAALRSPVAPAFYVFAPVLWLLALLATQVRGRKRLAAALVVAWMVVVGGPPLPDRVDLVVGLVTQAVVVGTTVGVVVRAIRAASQARVQAAALSARRFLPSASA